MKDGAGAGDVFSSFVECGVFALGGLMVGWLEEFLGGTVDACVSEVKSFEAADLFNDLVKKRTLRGPRLEERYTPRMRATDCSKERVRFWSVER